jgi:hypothetical protein
MIDFLTTYSPTSPEPPPPASPEPAPRDFAAEENRPDRGVAYIDVDAERIGTINTGIEEDLLLLVKASVEEVARVFQKIRGARRWEPDVHGRKVSWESDIYSVFRFRDQAWTIVRHEANERPVSGHDVTAEDARALSREIGTEVILHDLGADAERIGYRWYRSGNLIESFGAGPNHEDDAKEEWGEPVRFRSEVRTVEDLEAIDPLAFVDRFVRARDAFVPALPRALEGMKGKGTLELPGIDPEEVERLDIVIP